MESGDPWRLAHGHPRGLGSLRHWTRHHATGHVSRETSTRGPILTQHLGPQTALRPVHRERLGKPSARLRQVSMVAGGDRVSGASGGGELGPDLAQQVHRARDVPLLGTWGGAGGDCASRPKPDAGRVNGGSGERGERWVGVALRRANGWAQRWVSQGVGAASGAGNGASSRRPTARRTPWTRRLGEHRRSGAPGAGAPRLGTIGEA